MLIWDKYNSYILMANIQSAWPSNTSEYLLAVSWYLNQKITN